MWNKNNEAPGTPAARTPSSPAPAPAAWNPPSSPQIASPARNVSLLGSGISIKGQITGEEDLQIDGKIEGAISLPGQRLTVGRTAQLDSEVAAREVVVYGKVKGNLRANDRVEIRKDGSVVGDITTARISIEDGAYFKGKIEIDRSTHPAEERREEAAVPVAVMAN